MENASKALIIAGAVLISILLITIGIILINSGRDVIEGSTTQMSSQKIQTFNAQFTAYEGTKKGSEIKGIYNTVEASNAADQAHQVKITGIGNAGLIESGKKYTVTLTYSATNSATTEKGYISGISIQLASGSSGNTSGNTSGT